MGWETRSCQINHQLDSRRRDSTCKFYDGARVDSKKNRLPQHRQSRKRASYCIKLVMHLVALC